MSLATLMNSIGLGGITATQNWNTATAPYPQGWAQAQQAQLVAHSPLMYYSPDTGVTGVDWSTDTITTSYDGDVCTTDTIRNIVREELDKRQNESFAKFCEINHPKKEV